MTYAIIYSDTVQDETSGVQPCSVVRVSNCSNTGTTSLGHIREESVYERSFSCMMKAFLRCFAF